MPYKPLTHDENRRRVCAVCCNNRGVKACREVTEKEQVIIASEVINGYSRKNPYLPSGICKGCAFDLRRLTAGIPVKIHLPESYDCGLGRQTRSAGWCTCRWCLLGKMNGQAFQDWKKEVTGKTREPVIRMCQSCFQGVQEGKSHTCSASMLECVRNLAASLPKEVKEKLVVETLREKVAETGGGDMKLPQAKGGHPVHVHLGALPPSDLHQLTCKDVLTMSASAHLTGKQTDSVLADLRAVLGQKVIEPGVKDARVSHNGQYKEYFSSARVKFKNSVGEQVVKPFFWCSKLQEFLQSVASKRGRNLQDCTLKLGADGGKGFFKLTASIYIPCSSTPNQIKKRRSREDGVCGARFSETGQRKILLLAWCKDIPESAENLEFIYQAVDVNSVSFIMTGDYKLLMPSFGLMSCSSTHPCLYCARSRVKGVWEEVSDSSDMLRTYARNELMYGDWVEAGSKATTHWTSQFESVTGPVLLWGEDDTPSTRILDKVTPPTVHNLLALNSVLKPHLLGLWEGDMMEDLKNELNIVPHSYQGKDGAFAGPECAKFLNSLEKFKERLTANDALTLYYHFFLAFKQLKDGTFGTVLADNWKELCADFRTSLTLLNSCQGVPITPKLHVMAVHIEEWLDIHMRPMGDDSEQAVEASHGRFSKLWESYQVRDEDSSAFLKNGLAVGLQFNADNTNEV